MKYNPPEDDKTMKWLEWFGFLCLVSGIVLGFYWFGIKLIIVLSLFGISRIFTTVVNDYKKKIKLSKNLKKVLEEMKEIIKDVSDKK